MGAEVIIANDTYAKGVLVGNGEVCHLGNVLLENQTKKWTLICLISSISVVTGWIFGILMTFVSAMVIAGAFMITTAGGNAENMQKGKEYIIYAMIGLAVALLSRGFPEIIHDTFGR